MIESNIIERVAKNIGCPVEQLLAKHATVLSTNQANLEATGLGQDDIDMKCLRMAAAELRVVSARLAKSGCEAIEGMFISVPRVKDFAKGQYERMKTNLMGLDEDARTGLVAQGAIALFLNDDVKGGFRYVYNPTLEHKQVFSAESDEKHAEELPKAAMDINDGTGHFVIIADKSSPTWPNGGANFRYGRYKQQSEPMRDCVFLGRNKDNQTIRPIKVRFNGEDSYIDHPTFVTGTIPAKMGRDGKTAYAKKGVSVFSPDESLVSLYEAPPLDSDGKGLLPEHGIIPLSGFGDLEGWLTSLSDKERWDALCTLPLEVAHIDPREKGGFIITLADLDITSPIPPIDLWVSKAEEDKVDFSVGSIVVAVGGGWIDKNDGMPRMSVSGWWVMDAIEGVAQEEVLLDDDSSAEESGW